MNEIERVAPEDVVIEGEVLPDTSGIWDFLSQPRTASQHYVVDGSPQSNFWRSVDGRDEMFFNGAWQPVGYVDDSWVHLGYLRDE